MHKRRTERLLRKITAVLLSAALVAGTAQGAVPGNVLAKEDTGGGTMRPQRV